LLKAEKCDIIITDKNMPGLDDKGEEGGLDLLRYVRTELIPSDVIMMTGYATIDTAIKAMKLGAFDYLLKPFSLQELDEKINRLLVYRSFFNSDKTIQTYKGIQTEIIHLIEKKASMSDKNLDKALVSLNKKIDELFMLFKECEKYILIQRESLANINFFAEQMKTNIEETDPSYHLLNEILKHAGNRM
jgi:DNA-binding NtrC family response regulator